MGWTTIDYHPEANPLDRVLITMSGRPVSGEGLSWDGESTDEQQLRATLTEEDFYWLRGVVGEVVQGERFRRLHARLVEGLCVALYAAGSDARKTRSASVKASTQRRTA